MKQNIILFERDEYTLDFFKHTVENNGFMQKLYDKYFDGDDLLPFDRMPSYISKEYYDKSVKALTDFDNKLSNFSGTMTRKDFIARHWFGTQTLDLTRYTTILDMAKEYLELPNSTAPVATYNSYYEGFEHLLDFLAREFQIEVTFFDDEKLERTSIYGCREDFSHLTEDEIDDADQPGYLVWPTNEYDKFLMISDYDYEATAKKVIAEFSDLKDFETYIMSQDFLLQEEMCKIYNAALNIDNNTN